MTAADVLGFITAQRAGSGMAGAVAVVTNTAPGVAASGSWVYEDGRWGQHAAEDTWV